MLTVFYDGRCGLCDREIAFYRRRAKPGSVRWLLSAGYRLFLCWYRRQPHVQQCTIHTIDCSPP
ncbi:DCC1-like thiol-disulfide oxidoreductase family protein [Oceanimonas sp. CAM02]|uniref:DCC1-like thiol-disulfide oxidoreductase family protein n=1 Tax=Oceanimonas sp. CAM02 TaxID=3080336 RepID=UPI00293573A8|nr:DCC1-like thiol-disulfide oxidoreductase family protein [Oceanimonas sp. CAM02]MDV2858555.1 DCC1-like thiol-disulfide oxidoreductase family protein [Oceanimonas sp. CAM02]